MKQIYLISSPKDDIISRNCEAEYKSPSYLSKILEKRHRGMGRECRPAAGGTGEGAVQERDQRDAQERHRDPAEHIKLKKEMGKWYL